MDELVGDIERRKLVHAREASMEEKILDGPRLFKLTCEAIKSGLRIDFPEADEAEIHQHLIDRVYGNR